MFKNILLLCFLYIAPLACDYKVTFGFETDGTSVKADIGWELLSKAWEAKFKINCDVEHNKPKLKIALAQYINKQDGAKIGIILQKTGQQLFVENMHLIKLSTTKINQNPQPLTLLKKKTLKISTKDVRPKAQAPAKTNDVAKTKTRLMKTQTNIQSSSLLKKFWNAPLNNVIFFDINDDLSLSFHSFSFMTQEGIQTLEDIKSIIPQLTGKITEKKTILLLAAIKADFLNMIPRAFMQGVQEELKKRDLLQKKPSHRITLVSPEDLQVLATHPLFKKK